MNREGWGEGPWDDEPDHAVWIDPATDLDCMVNRGPSGALCGYVGVPPTHPWHGVRYNNPDHAFPDIDIEVHGGLTYANACQEDGDICHVPAEGREHDIWWFGFDCNHFLDFAPGMEADLRGMAERLNKPELLDQPTGPWTKHYRDWAYVTMEVTTLAQQLAEVKA